MRVVARLLYVLSMVLLVGCAGDASNSDAATPQDLAGAVDQSAIVDQAFVDQAFVDQAIVLDEGTDESVPTPDLATLPDLTPNLDFGPPPMLTSIAPAWSLAAGRAGIVITGSDFSGGQTTLTFDGAPLAATAITPTSITFDAPAHAVGTVSVTVTTPAGTSNALAFRYAGVPTLTAATPAMGTPNGGTIVTLTGTDLFAVTGVTFGGSAGTAIAESDGTKLTVTTPAKAKGASTVDVVATTSHGSATLTNGYTYGTVKLNLSALLDKDVIVNDPSGTIDPTQDAMDGSNYRLMTSTAAVALGGATAKGVPDDAFFAADGNHPDIQLDWRNSDNGANARILTGISSFTIPVPTGLYSAAQVYATSTEGSSSMRFTLHYTDNTTDVRSVTFSDWFNDPAAAGTFYLIDGLDRYSTSFWSAKDPAIWGANLAANATKSLDNILVEKITTSGYFVFFGAIVM